MPLYQQHSLLNYSSGLTIVADAGAPIKSIAGGSVVYSGVLKGYGNIITANRFSASTHTAAV